MTFRRQREAHWPPMLLVVALCMADSYLTPECCLAAPAWAAAAANLYIL